MGWGEQQTTDVGNRLAEAVDRWLDNPITLNTERMTNALREYRRHQELDEAVAHPVKHQPFLGF